MLRILVATEGVGGTSRRGRACPVPRLPQVHIRATGDHKGRPYECSSQASNFLLNASIAFRIRRNTSANSSSSIQG